MSWRSSLVVVTAWILSGGCVCAADSVTIAIYTTVLPVCRFSAPASGVDLTGPGPATAAITYRCTSGVAPTFTLTAACATCPDDPSAAPLILSDNSGVGRGMGSGRELTLIVTAPIAPPSFQTASLSTYRGAISVTVSP